MSLDNSYSCVARTIGKPSRGKPYIRFDGEEMVRPLVNEPRKGDTFSLPYPFP